MVKNFPKSFLIYFATVCVSLIGIVSSGSAQCAGQNPRIVNRMAPISSRITNFLEYLPLGYNPLGTTRYPVIINWSGLVQIDNGNFCTLLTTGLPKVLNDGLFPETVSNGTTNFSYI